MRGFADLEALPIMLCFHSCPLVAWVDCEQDYMKTTEQISMKLGLRMVLVWIQIKGHDLTFFNFVGQGVFQLLFNFSEKNTKILTDVNVAAGGP